MVASLDDVRQLPRAAVVMSTTLADVSASTEVTTSIVPTSASVTLRQHSQAATSEVTVHGSALPFDPRQDEGIFLQLYLGAVDTDDDSVIGRQFLRFVGFVDDLKEKRDMKGPVVTLTARDMSSIFRDFKPIPTAAMPRYSDTLSQAINRIIMATPGSQNPDGSLRVMLVENALTSRMLSGAVHSRASTAAVQLPHDVTAWQAIEHCCGLLSLLVSVDLDQLIVRQTQEVYGSTSPAVFSFIFGGESANLLSIEREKKFVRNRRGVSVTAYDPTTRSRVEGLYPPDGQVLRVGRPHAHVGGQAIHYHAPTRSTRASAASPAPPERDVYPAPIGMYAQASLVDYARRIYQERSRQEMEGKIECPFWVPEVLSLKNSDRIQIQLDPDLAAELQQAPSEAAAVDLLVQRLDVSEDAARALMRASLNRPRDTWYAREVTTEFQSDGVSTVSVGFINLIVLDPQETAS